MPANRTRCDPRPRAPWLPQPCARAWPGARFSAQIWAQLWAQFAARFPARLLPLSVLGLPAAPLAAQEPCLKLVFNRFCLGGDSTLLLQREAPALRQDDGERVALVYNDGPDSLYVLA